MLTLKIHRAHDCGILRYRLPPEASDGGRRTRQLSVALLQAQQQSVQSTTDLSQDAVRLYKALGPLAFVDEFVAANRDHAETKTNTRRSLHYREATHIVKKYHGSVPLKWWLFWPYAVWWRLLWRRRPWS